ncbi:MAG: hypothetical protein K8L97_09775 [Anaerolineae bacterium]|nr:hypothetical protein [Anaerolineae bacterium]
MTVFLATIGQRPQAITMALDVLLQRYPYECIGLLHTEPEYSGIANAYHQLRTVLLEEYSAIPLVSHELQYENGDPLLDIEDLRSADTYFHAVADVLYHYRIQNIPIHLLIAGGRKAMSVYATLAATLLFGEQDRVWTVLAPADLMASGVFRIPAGRYEDVHVVNLLVRPSRTIPGALVERKLTDILKPEISPRERFLADLTKQERLITEALRELPYASNDELAAHFHKSAKTIEHQFGSIYRKLGYHFDIDVTTPRKRQLLLDVIAGRV